MDRIRVIDTHTGGEPTRVVLDPLFDLSGLSLVEARDRFRTEYDDLRRAIICEPRGSDVWVGALLTPPVTQGSVAGVIFFNNVGYLGMCGHGTIGLAVALRHSGRINDGDFQIDTPVGSVTFRVEDGHSVTLTNVASYRFRKQVPVRLSNGRIVHGDIAWGGNWFFICHDHGESVSANNIGSLEGLAKEIRSALDRESITGEDAALIDHVELVGPSENADARNFVLCPGGAYDRSPCGTGTSAKVACLAADGLLEPGDVYRQESIVGSIFEATYAWTEGDRILPTITGSAYACAESVLILNRDDPFCMGIR